MKILHLDIETAPNDVLVWGFKKQDVYISQVLATGYTMCWAAKWDGEDTIMFASIFKMSKRKMLKRVYDLLCEADAVVHYNGARFDIPTLNWEFVKLGFKPPTPHINIDLYTACKRNFKAASLKLDFVAKELGLEGKVNHKGIQLWIECMGGKGVTHKARAQAWAEMEEYNRQDVVLTEQLYHELLGWIPNHPNHNTWNDDGIAVCVNCGGFRIHRKAMHYTRTYKYKRYRCADCGKYMRGRKVQLSAETKESMLVAAI